MSLRWRFSGLFLCCALLVQFVIAWWSYHDQADRVTEEQRATLARIADRLAASLSTPVWTVDEDQYTGLIQADANRDTIVNSICLQFDDRTLVTEANRPPQWFMAPPAAEGEFTVERPVTHSDRPGQVLAQVTLSANPTYVADRMAEYVTSMQLHIAITTTFLAVLVITLVNRTVLSMFSPILSILHQAPESKRASKNGDELQQLSAGAQILLGHLSGILDAIGDGVMTINTNGILERINPAARTLFPHIQAGDHLNHILPKDSAWNKVATTILDAALVHHYAWHCVDPLPYTDATDSPILLRVAAHPLPDKTGAVCIFRDVTQEETNRNRALQSEKMESIGRLAGGIAHDSNNILTAIMGAAESLRLEVTPQQKQRLTDIILSCCEQTADFNRKLLTFARKDVGEQHVLNLSEVVDQAATLLRHSLGRNYPIKVTLPEHAVRVRMDRSSVVNALINLGVNAKDAMPIGGTLAIHLDTLDQVPAAPTPLIIMPTGPCARLRLRDRGTGIEPQVIERIFEPFFTTKPDGKGTGLGLAAVMGTAQSHHGTLAVESSPEGTEFTLYFPLVTTLDAHVATPLLPLTPLAPPTPSTDTHVLIVDDDDAVRDLVCHFIRLLGCTVTAAPSGEVAVQILAANCQQSSAIHFVIMDVRMPGMDGPTTWATMHALYPHLRCLFISGYSGDADLQGEGVVGFLSKPFDFTLLQSTVATSLGIQVKPAR